MIYKLALPEASAPIPGAHARGGTMLLPSLCNADSVEGCVEVSVPPYLVTIARGAPHVTSTTGPAC